MPELLSLTTNGTMKIEAVTEGRERRMESRRELTLTHLGRKGCLSKSRRACP